MAGGNFKNQNVNDFERSTSPYKKRPVKTTPISGAREIPGHHAPGTIFETYLFSYGFYNIIYNH